LFGLTQRGKDLEPVIAALGRWGAPLLSSGGGKEEFCDHWVILPLRLYVRDKFPKGRPVTIGLRAGDEDATLRTSGTSTVNVQSGRAANPDARIEGGPQQILALLTGKTHLKAAIAKGIRYEGDPRTLERFGSA
jgi:hypothetical protein